MARLVVTSNRALGLAIIVSLVMVFMPRGGISGLLAEIVEIALNPFAEGLNNTLGAWIRPPAPESRDGALLGGVEQVLQQELEEFKRRAYDAEADVARLQEQIAQLQQLPPESMKTPVQPVVARVGLRAPGEMYGSVVLSRGSNAGVTPGTIAIYNGVHLLGRVTQDVSRVKSTLLPLPNIDSGYLVGVVIPREGAVNIGARPSIQLKPTGDGTFAADADQSMNISAGDEVRLNDESWPPPAQMMVIGYVESVKPKPSEPLRNVVTVRPRYHVAQLPQVVLKIELHDDGAGSAVGDGEPRP